MSNRIGRAIYGALLGALYGTIFVPIGLCALAFQYARPQPQWNLNGISFDSRSIVGILAVLLFGSICGALIGGTAGGLIDPRVELSGDTISKAIFGFIKGLVPGVFIGWVGVTISVGTARIIMGFLGKTLPSGRDVDILMCGIGFLGLCFIFLPLGMVANKSKTVEKIMTFLTCGLMLVLCSSGMGLASFSSETMTIGAILGAIVGGIAGAIQEAEKP